MAYKKIRIGIIGVGMIGQHHINTYKKIPDAEIVAICDIDEREAKKVCETYNIPDWTPDFRKLIKRDDIDAIDVCTHNNMHAPMTIEALKAGKHVYCEKSMAGTWADSVAMVEASKRFKRKLSIQIGSLFTLQTKAAKTLVDAGKLGKIYHIRSTGFRRRGRPYVDGYGRKEFVDKKISGGGSTLDMMIYHVGCLLYLLKFPEVTRVCGKTYQEMPMDERRRRISKYNVEELTTGFVRFKNNLSLDIIEAWAVNLKGMEGSCLCGSMGGVRFDPFEFYNNIGDLEMTGIPDLESANFRWHRIYDNHPEAYDEPQHWVAALQGKVPLLPTDRAALDTMFICDGLFLSEKLGREVTAAEIVKHSKSNALKI